MATGWDAVNETLARDGLEQVGWWHDEPKVCNHFAYAQFGECGRESGEWKPVYTRRVVKARRK